MGASASCIFYSYYFIMIRKSDHDADDLTGISPLLTYSEAGCYLRKSAGFIRGEVYAGKLSASRIGRTPYVAREELDRYIAERREVGDAARRPRLRRRPAAVKATDEKELAPVALDGQRSARPPGCMS